MSLKNDNYLFINNSQMALDLYIYKYISHNILNRLRNLLQNFWGEHIYSFYIFQRETQNSPISMDKS